MESQSVSSLTQDLELAAMASVTQSLAPLDLSAQARVLNWAYARFSIPQPSSAAGDTELAASQKPAHTAYEHFGELFRAFSPKSESEKALVAAYWLQVVQGKPTFTGGQVNAVLKELGHQVAHISMALQRYLDEHPSLIVQIRKNGSARQSHKTLKLSGEGIAMVESRLQ